MENGNPPSITLYDDELTFSFPHVHPDARLKVAFCRTLRIPDDGCEYPMPARLGRFALGLVDDHPLPEGWKRRGGVFLPMFSSEAMVVEFSGDYPMAVKVAAGKINVVDGRPWTDTLDEQQQDYLVSCQQHWLYGFNSEPGRAGQFVATPLGDGVSVEEQLSGKALWGGLQLLVHPMKGEHYERLLEERARLAARLADARFSLAPESPAMGLGIGGHVRQTIVEDPWGAEVWDTSQRLRTFVHLLHARDFPGLTGLDLPMRPLTAKHYVEAGIPWYDWDISVRGVDSDNAFAGVGRVSQRLASSNALLFADQPIAVSDVIYLGRRIEPDEW